MQIDQLRAVVTGGASGIGRVFVEQLVAAGARVAFCDLNEEAVASLDAQLGQSVWGMVVDVSAEDEVQAMISHAALAWGGLDLLVNNAGIFRDGLLVRPNPATGDIERLSLESWQRVIDVDLTGPFLCAREFAASVLTYQVEHSLIVNISSVARHGNPGQSNYSAAKAGLVADTRLWAHELARYGIRVAAIAPGFVQTPILDAMKPQMLNKMLAKVPLGRAGTPQEIWQVLHFLISCDYITGTCIEVDGGLRL